MLKLIKSDKNTIIYKSMPFLVFILKWCDTKCLILLKGARNGLQQLTAWYQLNISKKIDKLYTQKSITKIKPKTKKKVK